MKRSAIYKPLSLGVAGLLLLLFEACIQRVPKGGTPCQPNARLYRQNLLRFSHLYRSLSGHVKINVQTPEERVSFSGELYATSPDRLHFDIFGFLHRPRFLLIKNGDLLAWRDFDSGRHYLGPLETCPSFPIKIPFPPRFLKDFVRILFLNFPPPLRITPTGRSKDSCLFLLKCGWGTFNLVIDPVPSLPSEITGPQNSPAPFRITFSEYTETPGYHMKIPFRYGISIGKDRVTLRFTLLKINPDIPDRYFIPLM